MLWYSNVQFLAFAVNTTPEYHRGKYRAHQQDTQDIRRRCEIMEQVALAARRRANTSSYCLKVFVAPEFFFRGSKGAYSMEGVQTLVRTLRQWTRDDAWKHWVFFFGTLMVTFENDANQREILNLALVQKGGAGEEDSRIVQKEILASADLLTQADLSKNPRPRHGAITQEQVVGIKTREQYLAAQNRGPGKELQSHGFDGNGIFDLAGIRFAVEVCADHLSSRLALSPPAWLEYYPQLQVVTSCGVSQIDEDSVVATQGGYAFLCDGYFQDPNSGNGARSQLRKITTARRGNQPAVLQEIDPSQTLALTGSMPAHWQTCLGTAGELHIYPAQPVPWAKVRWW